VAYAVSDEIKKSLTLDDLEGQYCNRNCLRYSASSLAKRFYCEKMAKSASDICFSYLRV